MLDRSIGANTINSKQLQEVVDQAARALLRDQAQGLRGQRLKAAQPLELKGELRVVLLRLHDARLVQSTEKLPTYYRSVTAVVKSRLACVFRNMYLVTRILVSNLVI